MLEQVIHQLVSVNGLHYISESNVLRTFERKTCSTCILKNANYSKLSLKDCPNLNQIRNHDSFLQTIIFHFKFSSLLSTIIIKIITQRVYRQNLKWKFWNGIHFSQPMVKPLCLECVRLCVRVCMCVPCILFKHFSHINKYTDDITETEPIFWFIWLPANSKLWVFQSLSKLAVLSAEIGYFQGLLWCMMGNSASSLLSHSLSHTLKLQIYMAPSGKHCWKK